MHYLISLGHIHAGEALITLLDAKTKPTLPGKLRVFYKATGKASPVKPAQVTKQPKGERFHHYSLVSVNTNLKNQCFLILIISGSKSPTTRNTSIGLHRCCIFPFTHTALGSALKTRSDRCCCCCSSRYLCTSHPKTRLTSQRLQSSL